MTPLFIFGPSKDFFLELFVLADILYGACVLSQTKDKIKCRRIIETIETGFLAANLSLDPYLNVDANQKMAGNLNGAAILFDHG